MRGRDLVLLGSVVALCGCWQTRQGRAPPDLATQVAEVDATLLRLERVSLTVDRELEDLSSRSDAFFGAAPQVWRRPFPLDAFKHTAMSCLNAPYNEAEPDPAVQQAAERLGITCAVPAAVDLEYRLQETPGQRRKTLEKLVEIDGVRNVRSRLQTRLRQLPSILRRTRSYLGARRVEARQLVKDVQSRQSDYNRRSYQEAMSRIEAYEARLARLEREIGELDEATGRWSKRLGELVDRLYKDLSRLGRS